MKNMLLLTILIGMLLFSGFTNGSGIESILTNTTLLQEETTETPDPVETTEVPASTSTPVPTPTSIPTATLEPTATLQPTSTPQPAYSRPLLNLTSYSYDSYVYAGGYFTLSSIFKNQGQERAYNIVITYSSSSFTADSNGGVTIISSIGAGESVSTSQDFAASTSISSSPATINVNVEYKDVNGQSFTQSFAVSITVTGYGTYYTSTPSGRPQIIVANYETDVDPLEPGTTFVLTMNLQNRGYLTAQNVSLVIGSSGDSSSDSVGSDNFLPIGSSNVQVIGDVAVQQYIQIQQGFVVNSDAAPGVYPLNLSFSYTDEDGNEFSDNQIITLLVHLVPTIEISFYEEPDTMAVGEDATLPIQVVNMGSDSILLGDIYINVENATLTNNLTFIGNLESGGSFTIDTDINPQAAGTLPVNITINYQDNFKKAQTITQTLSITVQDFQVVGVMQNDSVMATQMVQSFQINTQTNSSFFDVVLRFLRGMIGFDSSAGFTRNRINPGSMNIN